ncbi:MAG: aminoacetone oxidase family FAD-binding enzyme, partial [Chitinophagaceae bacterium]
LITHWGLSGPAILRLSAWGARYLQELDYNFTVNVNWVAPLNEGQVGDTLRSLRFVNAAQKIANKNPFNLPFRLWIFLIEQTGISSDIRCSDVPAPAQNKLVKNLCCFECRVKGKTTFKDEFVTAGGINLSEIDTNTMQSRLVPGLFFAGEVMDADGITGGYNFQHAWTSGWIVADSVSRMSISQIEHSPPSS